MKSKYVGVDISKDWLDMSVWDDKSQKPLPAKRVENNMKGITSMVSGLKKNYKGEKLWFCFEHTGHYGMLLSCVLENMEVSYSAVPALEVKQSLGITRARMTKWMQAAWPHMPPLIPTSWNPAGWQHAI